MTHVPLKGYQIANILSGYSCYKDLVDILPFNCVVSENIQPGQFVILNTKNSTSEGQGHWCALFHLPTEEFEVFNSLGKHLTL